MVLTSVLFISVTSAADRSVDLCGTFLHPRRLCRNYFCIYSSKFELLDVNKSSKPDLIVLRWRQATSVESVERIFTWIMHFVSSCSFIIGSFSH